MTEGDPSVKYNEFYLTLHNMFVLIAGLPGTGKTFLAKNLLSSIFSGFISLSTDEVRRLYFGLSEHQYMDFNQKIYSQDKRDIVYNVINLMVDILLTQGFSVVVEGTFYRQEKREKLLDICNRLSHQYIIIKTIFSDELMEARLQNRELSDNNVSDARYQIYLALKERFETIVQPHLIIDTQQSITSCIEEVKRYYDEIPS